MVGAIARLQVAPWDSDSLMLPACTLFPSFTSSPSSTPSIPLSSSPLGPWGNYKGTPLRPTEERRGEPFSLCVSEGRGGRKRFIGGKKEKEGKVVRRFFATPSLGTPSPSSPAAECLSGCLRKERMSTSFFLTFSVSQNVGHPRKREKVGQTNLGQAANLFNIRDG